MHERLRDYWEDPKTVSIIDANLHDLEMDRVLRHLRPTDTVADIGCGDGEATVRYASHVNSVVGIERSAHLRARASEAAARSGSRNLTIEAGDVMTLADSERFDAVVSQRLLINLATWEEQQQAIRNIHRALRPGGRFIMVENTDQAFAAMNGWRGKVGLPAVPQHWHNLFFDHELLMAFMRGGFELERHYDFGMYYLLTRVYVPMFAQFTGFGASAVKDPIYERSDAAARKAFDLFGDRVSIDAGPAFGPIQVFVFRRSPAWSDPADDRGKPRG